MSDTYTVRRATMDDVKDIHALLMENARKGLLLPRALIFLYGHVRNFLVIDDPRGGLAACCALAPVWEDLAEVCSLAVREDLRKQGLGRKIVMACVDDCRILHLKKVFSLTYQAAFFERIGFHEVDKGVLPQKIWADCVHCAKYPDCDETAMFLPFTVMNPWWPYASSRGLCSSSPTSSGPCARRTSNWISSVCPATVRGHPVPAMWCSARTWTATSPASMC